MAQITIFVFPKENKHRDGLMVQSINPVDFQELAGSPGNCGKHFMVSETSARSNIETFYNDFERILLDASIECDYFPYSYKRTTNCYATELALFF